MDSLVDQKLFGGVYYNKKVLITGISGFKGSWLAKWLGMLGAKVSGIGLEPESSRSHFSLLGLTYHNVDIRNVDKLKEIIEEEQPDLIFHLAAQALVRKSYHEPIVTYETNIIGSLNLYSACTERPNLKGIVSITSDKVYENKEQLWPYRETDELGGFDMYSSSKACMELMTASFTRAFEHKLSFPIVTARAGNVIGGGDWAEDRLIPDMVRAAEKKESVHIRHPEAVRPWQHVLEPLSGYLILGKNLLSSNSTITGAWNFGPITQTFISVEEVLKLAQTKWNKIKFEFDRPNDKLHEAGILAVDSSKSNKLLKWTPVWATHKAIDVTISWYKSFLNTQEVNTMNDIRNYVADAKEQKLNWTSV